jgi:hypothetical protein
MKIAITGHSKGLGAEFAKYYQSQNHTVMGFSRANGYDLRDWSKMQHMLAQIKDADMFINCAKPDFVQTTTLYELWKLWKGQNRTIVNISSVLSYFPTCATKLFDDPHMDLYRTAKVSLNEASAQLSMKSHLPRIILVKPVHLYSNPITDNEQKALTTWVETFVLTLQNINQVGLKLFEITF